MPTAVRARLRQKFEGRRAAIAPRHGPDGQIGITRFAQGSVGVTRTAILNHPALVHGARSDREIEVRNRADDLDRIAVAERAGVDPDRASGADFAMASDAFFAAGAGGRRRDPIFIDGLHQAGAVARDVARDIANPRDALAPGGTIVLHHLNPPTARRARERAADRVPGGTPDRNGSAWHSFAAFGATRDDLEMSPVDAHRGRCVIRRGRQRPCPGPRNSHAVLERHRRELRNPIPVREFRHRNRAGRPRG